MGYLGEFLGSGSTTTKGLYHLNGNATDSSGNGNNGTATNVTWGSGRLGSNGATTSTNTYIQIPNNILGTIGTGNFVISLWMNPVQPAVGRYPMLFGSYINPSPFTGPTIFYDPRGVNGFGDGIQFRCINSNPLNITTPSASSLQGKRTNIVFTRVSGVMFVFYDGQLVGGRNDNTNIPSADAARIVSRNSIIQLFGVSGAQFDEYIIENKFWLQADVTKYYTYSKGKFGIL